MKVWRHRKYFYVCSFLNFSCFLLFYILTNYPYQLSHMVHLEKDFFNDSCQSTNLKVIKELTAIHLKYNFFTTINVSKFKRCRCSFIHSYSATENTCEFIYCQWVGLEKISYNMFSSNVAMSLVRILRRKEYDDFVRNFAVWVYLYNIALCVVL